MLATIATVRTTPNERATVRPARQDHASARAKAIHAIGHGVTDSVVGSAVKMLTSVAPVSHPGFHVNCAATTSKPSPMEWAERLDVKTCQIAHRFPESDVACWNTGGSHATTSSATATSTGVLVPRQGRSGAGRR